MAFKVFYAWQHDRPNNLCRGFIRRALDRAVAQLNDDLEIEDAVREVEIDQDTQGVAGSPSVADTILAKIRECDAFVPDLTFIPAAEGSRATPNPNVLIEYGYALHSMGDQRIVGVFNEAFGRPDDLPFDLQHKRWPIRYEAADDSDNEDAQSLRRATREQLANRLADAIRDIIHTFAQLEEDQSDSAAESVAEETPAEPAATQPSVFAPQPLVQRRLPNIAEQYPWEDGVVGVRDDISSTNSPQEVRLLDGPSLFLRLKSRAAGQRISNVRTMEIARGALRPMAADRAHGWSYVRSRHGVAAFTFADNAPNTARTASMLTRSREIYGIDRQHLQAGRLREEFDFPFIPTGAIEEILIDALANFLSVSEEHSKLPLPIEVAAGIEGVEGYRLAVDRKYFGFDNFVGHIFSNNIGHTETIDDYNCDPFNVLLPLFEDIYDSAGYERPNVRTMGRSQR